MGSGCLSCLHGGSRCYRCVGGIGGVANSRFERSLRNPNLHGAAEKPAILKRSRPVRESRFIAWRAVCISTAAHARPNAPPFASTPNQQPTQTSNLRIETFNAS
jgi:hypothetical protein